jgi:hypothetical protein
VPDGRLVSFGIAGALAPDLPVGTVIDATRVVGRVGRGAVGGRAARRRGARPGTILGRRASSTIRTSARACTRRQVREAVDMESGPLARSGRLAGCLARRERHAVPAARRRRAGGNGRRARRPRWVSCGASRAQPIVTLRAVFGARRALKSLEALA